MTVRGTRFSTFLAITLITINFKNANSWDLAVTVGPNIDFLLKNGTVVRNMENSNAVALSIISYDDMSQTIFVSDKKSTKTLIFNKSLQSNGTKMNTLLNKTEGTRITGIIYDPQTQSLFWTDYVKRAIYRMHIGTNMNSIEPEVLLNLTDQNPRGLSFDLCKRRLYWVNSNRSHPSIMSSNIDGTEQAVVISDDLYQPVAVTIDHTTAKLYWLDDTIGIRYKIERSNLDGTKRELLIEGRHQTPFHIAVDYDNIYWTDSDHNAIWSIKKNMTTNNKPQTMKIYPRISKKESRPEGLLTRVNVENVNCSIMEAAKTANLADKVENIDGNVYAMADIDVEDEYISTLCLNGGYFNKTTNNCRCKQGFNGQLCERSLCQNYCLNGKCHVTSADQVRCECPSEYSGARCEKYVCSDYCLNGGKCSIKQGKPYCTCKFSHGNRCENSNDTTEKYAGRLHELKKTNISFCSCSKRNSTDQEYNIYQDNSWNKILIVIFPIIIAVLTILVMILSYFVIKFRRRPRIRKRFVVSKTGITPLTSRPQISNGECEITIENCCNMNICETPCFEPQLVNPHSNTMGRDEKSLLVENMEGNYSC